MVTQRTLADVLIEAGFEPEAALRASDMIEQDLSDLARQSEVNLRFDQMDERFIAQDRAIEARFAAQERMIDERFAAQDRMIDERFAAQDRMIDERFAAQERVIDARFDGVDRDIKALDTRITDLRSEFMGHLQALKESMDRRFAVFTWALGLVFAALLAVFGALIAVLVELFSRGP